MADQKDACAHGGHGSQVAQKWNRKLAPATRDGNLVIQVFNFGVARTLFDRSDRAYYGLDVNRADVPPLKGIVYFTLPGETPDPEEPATPAAPTEPPPTT